MDNLTIQQQHFTQFYYTLVEWGANFDIVLYLRSIYANSLNGFTLLQLCIRKLGKIGKFDLVFKSDQIVVSLQSRKILLSNCFEKYLLFSKSFKKISCKFSISPFSFACFNKANEPMQLISKL